MLFKKNSIVKLVLVLLVLSPFTQAQSTGTAGKDSSNSESKNLYSLQFYLVNGLSIAGKKQLSDNSALRLHFDFSADLVLGKLERKGIYQSIHDTSVGYFDRDHDSNSENISISFQYLYYPYKSKIIGCYVGGGPQFVYNRNFSKYEEGQSSSSSSYNNIYEINGNTYNLGMLFLTGCEANISNNISLFAEYKLSVNHNWDNSDTEYIRLNQSNSEERTEIYENKSTSWNLNLSNVKIGLTINF